ncbi:hypothetical protein CCMSSC00406_0001635 [Pleurotus cornucopiae]|uniref:Uncharacterized protein n=1 Tax=Pleurotus cornucopiae TaxID=5321 RepID=A0ACB7INE5_PLECO|nr:hypothetical protein CCMSSC00406_0001635 [Pleurotus cornucopiae]
MFSVSTSSIRIAARPALSFAGRYTTTRNVRIRPRATPGAFASDPLARDERLLKKLEDQLARVKDKVRREEEEEEKKAKAAAEAFAHSSSTNSDAAVLANHNDYFWNQVLTKHDRRQLARVGITSRTPPNVIFDKIIVDFDLLTVEDLYSVYSEAQKTIDQPPYPSLDTLDSRLQIAHTIYNSIPAKIGEVTRATQKKGVWW